MMNNFDFVAHCGNFDEAFTATAFSHTVKNFNNVGVSRGKSQTGGEEREKVEHVDRIELRASSEQESEGLIAT